IYERSGWRLAVGGWWRLPVQALRVVHEKFRAQWRRRGDARQQIDQVTVVRHVSLEIRVRPIGAPEHAVGERLDDAACEGHEVVVPGRSAARQGLRAADLRTEVLGL